MPLIQAEAVTMHAVASQFRDTTAALHDSQRSAVRTVGDLSQNFRGPKITSLITQSMHNIQREYDKLNANLMEYANFIDTAAVAYDETQKDLAKRILAVFGVAIAGGVIPSPGNPGGGTAPVTPPPSGTVPGDNGGYVLKDVDYYRREYNANKGDCVSFARAFVEGELKKTWPGTAGYTLRNQTPIAPGVIYNGTPPAPSDIVSMFANAQPGDVVQMFWDNDGRQTHTAIFAGVENGQIKFLHGNYGLRENRGIHITPFTPEQLARLLTTPNGGMNVYRL